jgi:DNA-binding CsgD family transcriptional regulator/pimeloyl-ACP methyl ester carboxylesterase
MLLVVPVVKYVRSGDGVSIAYWTLGEGRPLLMTANLPTGHAQLEWQIPAYRHWYERLAGHRMLISYNARGSGLSDRNPADYSLDAHVMDVEAIIERLQLQTLDMFGILHTSTVAIAYAAQNAEKVSRLVTWGGYLKGSDYSRSPRIQASRAMVAKDWDSYVETLALFAFGWSDEESARRSVDLIRESVTQDGMLRAISEIELFDVSELAERVTCPTLVLQARKAAWPSVDTAQRLAAAIPGARLMIVEGDRVLPFGNDTDAIVEAVDSFLSESEPAPPAVAAPANEDERLTAREAEVLRLLANGHSNKEIAGELSLSVHTIERHLANVYAKIGARGRADATAYALRNGLA